MQVRVVSLSNFLPTPVAVRVHQSVWYANPAFSVENEQLVQSLCGINNVSI